MATLMLHSPDVVRLAGEVNFYQNEGYIPSGGLMYVKGEYFQLMITGTATVTYGIVAEPTDVSFLAFANILTGLDAVGLGTVMRVNGYFIQAFGTLVGGGGGSTYPGYNEVTFTASGSWVVPENVFKIWPTLISGGGGGGGGGGTPSNALLGGGGGGGGTSGQLVGWNRNTHPGVDVTPGETLTIVVGAGGAGSAASGANQQGNIGQPGGGSALRRGATNLIPQPLSGSGGSRGRVGSATAGFQAAEGLASGGSTSYSSQVAAGCTGNATGAMGGSGAPSPLAPRIVGGAGSNGGSGAIPTSGDGQVGGNATVLVAGPGAGGGGGSGATGYASVGTGGRGGLGADGCVIIKY